MTRLGITGSKPGGKGAAIAAALLALATLGAQQDASAQPAPQQGGTLNIALNSDIRSLEPGINRDSNTDRVMHSIFEGLVAYRDDLTVGPQLADSWTISADGLTYTFKLRDGATFHNGRPVTSTEVKWSWDRQFANAAWPCQRFFNGTGGLKVDAVETADATTVVYRLAAPSAVFLKQLANVQCGIVVAHPASVDAENKWQQPIGTGPFKLREWRRNEFVSLERVGNYAPSRHAQSGYAGARVAYVDEVRFRIIPDKSAAQAALATGEIDVLPDVEPLQVRDLRSRGLTVESGPGLSWSVFLMQTKDPLLGNLKIRQAIAHAIDLRQLAEARTQSLVKANPSAVSEVSAYHGPAFATWPAHDPARARTLLREAGYSGQPIKLQTNRRFESMFENAVIIQAMLTAVGMKVEIETLDWAAQLDNYLKGNFQMQAFGFSARFDPGLMYQAFIGDKAKGAFHQFDDARAIQLLAESMGATNEAKRTALLQQLHALHAEQVPMIGLHYPPNIDAVRSNVRGYKVWAANTPRAWGVWKAR
jgi:peptide/nickel transport system substrate-binding protein